MSDRGATLLPLVLVACAASAPAPTKFSGKSTRVDVALETAGSPSSEPVVRGRLGADRRWDALSQHQAASSTCSS